MVSLCEKKTFLSLIRFVSLDQIPKIKICHMVASEHREVIELRRRFLDTDVIGETAYFQNHEGSYYDTMPSALKI